MKAVSIIGTRPEIIKLTPLVPGLDSMFEHRIVHTGQHYDYYMSEIFFKELGLREPDYTLETPVKDSSKQVGYMLTGLSDVFQIEKPNACIVVGDTNSALAGALSASKHHIPLIHVEAGLRSFDKNMPEEVNRIVIDHVSDLLFAPSSLASQNLVKEGIRINVFLTGNTGVDCCLKFLPSALNDRTVEKLGLKRNEYVVLTVHREANTERENLLKIVEALIKLHDVQIVFPAHPRTRQKLIDYGFWDVLWRDNLKIIEPLSYVKFLNLMLNSKFVLTDSGGIQEDAITLKVPCLTLRENTERWETVNMGANKLVGLDTDRIVFEVEKAWRDDEWKKRLARLENPYGDGGASNKIISIMNNVFPIFSKATLRT
ncbi:UDP-N-acetylglucosamine 2-epimerase (non-hydrolyzing) [Candidatus Bathyarchaeota archaeon]|nr:UDP-N-acetylglucosamine 2-epimerase (non-hydrolyzing) [Candidatus Bathyarchaeota archaeon]